MIRVSVVDDHPIVRQGISSVLHTQPDLRVQGVVATENDLTAEDAPEVLILDWELQGHGGASTIVAIRTRFPGCTIVVFSAYTGDERVGAALAAGAKGYVLKGSAATELITAIRVVAAGGTFLGTGVPVPSIDAREQLTKRELEVLRLAATGLSNAEIGAQLAVSARTVKFHMNSIFGRLGASRRAQAVAIAKERGLF